LISEARMLIKKVTADVRSTIHIEQAVNEVTVILEFCLDDTPRIGLNSNYSKMRMDVI
jgi:hypothetical protein